MKYIDAEKLKKFVESIGLTPQKSADYNDGRDDVKRMVLDFIDPLQQDEKAVELEMCSQAYWEEQGWIMIPPDVTIEGIDSLLKQVRKKLRQEQPNLPGYDMALLEVKSKVDELYEETSIGHSEYDCGLYNGIVEICMKLRGFIKARLDSDEHPEADLEKASRNVYESWMGGTMDDVRRDMVELGKILNARKK